MGEETVTLVAKGAITKDGVALLPGTAFECEKAQAQALLDVGAAVLAGEEPPPPAPPGDAPPATEPEKKPEETPGDAPPAIPPTDQPPAGSPEVTTPESEMVIE